MLADILLDIFWYYNLFILVPNSLISWHAPLFWVWMLITSSLRCYIVLLATTVPSLHNSQIRPFWFSYTKMCFFSLQLILCCFHAFDFRVLLEHLVFHIHRICFLFSVQLFPIHFWIQELIAWVLLLLDYVHILFWMLLLLTLWYL